jgi:hypothetical protein
MSTAAIFPSVPARTGMYESFYLRAVSPHEPLGIWLRYTVDKPPGLPARALLWCTVFDPRLGDPFQVRESHEELRAPADAWIEVGEARMGPSSAQGTCGGVSWSLRFTGEEPELRHLPQSWMYRAPLPRTKLSSPLPAARFNGTLELDGRVIELHDWPGMVGHNWGAEHAERWIWLHAVDFEDSPGTWLDVAIGRLLIAGRMTPWVANGALSLDGRRHRIGGLGARGLLVAETASRCRLTLPGADGLLLDARVGTPAQAGAHWVYDDPAGGEHDVTNCSIAGLDLIVHRADVPALTLRCSHGAAYELGTRAGRQS